ncbi:MAG: hypothetical protein ACOY46_19870 [Bacillota bacterium]
MPLQAWKDGVTTINQDNMNALLLPQSWRYGFEGAQFDSKTGAGIYELDNASNDLVVRVTLTSSRFDRIEVELDKHGDGADIIIELRDATFNPDGSSDGLLLASYVVPKEWLPAAKAYFALPVVATGLTLGNVWVIIKGAGDVDNHFHVISETSHDAAHPCYTRVRGGSGAWTAEYAAHFRAYAGTTGKVRHIVYPGAGYCIRTLNAKGNPTNLKYYILAGNGEAVIKESFDMSYDASGTVLLGGGE